VATPKKTVTATHRVTREAAPQSAAPAAAAAPAATPSVAPAAEIPAAPVPAGQPAITGTNDTALELGGGALALLALGGAALAVNRRKRRREEEGWEDETVEPLEPTVSEPVAEEPMTLHQPIPEPQPAILAPPLSAFSWDIAPQQRSQVADADRHPGETWAERAMRGPTPDNPSQSLRKRLKRAAFFDKREREVAEGDAAPVDAEAGLPENIEEPERQLEAA